MRLVRQLAAHHFAVGADEHSLASLQVKAALVAVDVQHRRLGRACEPRTFRGLLLTKDARLDAVRIAEGHHAHIRQHRDDRVRALHITVDALDGVEHILGIHEVSRTHALVQRRRERKQNHLDIARAVEPRAAVLEVLFVQLDEVRDIPVVGHRHAQREGQVEGLRIILAATTHRGVAHMAHAEMTAQARHILLVEDLEHEAETLLHMEGVGEGGDARSILSPVLNREEPFVDLACDVDAVRPVDADEAAHGGLTSLRVRGSRFHRASAAAGATPRTTRPPPPVRTCRRSRAGGSCAA